MKIKLGRQEREHIADNRKLVNRIANADLIAATCGGWTRLIWMRPIEAVRARGPTCNVFAIEFEAADENELLEYRAIVRRLKGSCEPWLESGNPALKSK